MVGDIKLPELTLVTIVTLSGPIAIALGVISTVINGFDLKAIIGIGGGLVLCITGAWLWEQTEKPKRDKTIAETKKLETETNLLKLKYYKNWMKIFCEGRR